MIAYNHIISRDEVDDIKASDDQTWWKPFHPFYP